MPTKPDDIIRAAIGADIKEELKIACAKERVTMSKVLRNLVVRWLEEREGLPQAVQPDNNLTSDEPV